MANVVNWFEIPVNDIQKAKTFYEKVFGHELTYVEMESTQMAWFPMGEGEEGSTGTLVKAEGYTPSHEGTTVYFSVDDIEATLGKVVENSGKTLLPKYSIGEYGFIAHFEDTEGNRIALHSKKLIQLGGK